MHAHLYIAMYSSCRIAFYSKVLFPHSTLSSYALFAFTIRLVSLSALFERNIRGY